MAKEKDTLTKAFMERPDVFADAFNFLIYGDKPVIRPEELDRFYPEFNDYREQCRFPDCANKKEPGCAVKEALKAGRIEPERYESYSVLYDELISSKKR